MNLVPYGDELALNVDVDDNRISKELAIQVAPRFGITEAEANIIVDNILKTVKQNWEKQDSTYGLSRRQIEEMHPAFSLCFE